MAYWHMKIEPDKWSWEDQVEKGEGRWEKRVRNYQARNNMQKMKKGDKFFFYHTGKVRSVIGIMEVTGESYPDPDDPDDKFVTVDVKPVEKLPTPVSLSDIKEHPALENMRLVKQGRLSVGEITEDEWNVILDMSKRAAKD